ncbi:nucleoside/nucleotide kinase family protein [Streptomyces chilikensis]|uniref:Nucleoside/nucleotide kinase family protein n=1 Tax=Streptomyces chilikensis TaxID=1194079 RepID=A0ABV3ELB2_9ACTN
MDATTLLRETLTLTEGTTGRVILGIAGAPGAGKSTLAEYLVAAAGERLGPGSTAYVPMDGFHLSNAQLARLGLTGRKGSEPSFDGWGYAALLRRIREHGEEPVYAPGYSRSLHEPVAALHVVEPSARLVVTEGNYLAVGTGPWPSARACLDELWFLDAPDAVREERLRGRHTATGSSAEVARARVTGNDRPNGLLVAATRNACDRVITLEGPPGPPPRSRPRGPATG